MVIFLRTRIIAPEKLGGCGGNFIMIFSQLVSFAVRNYVIGSTLNGALLIFV